MKTSKETGPCSCPENPRITPLVIISCSTSVTAVHLGNHHAAVSSSPCRGVCPFWFPQALGHVLTLYLAEDQWDMTGDAHKPRPFFFDGPSSAGNYFPVDCILRAQYSCF